MITDLLDTVFPTVYSSFVALFDGNAQLVGVAWLVMGAIVAWMLKGKRSLDMPV